SVVDLPVSLCLTVPQSQTWSSSLLEEVGGAAPVLLEEHPQAVLRGSQVLLRVHGSQHRVLRDPQVELVDNLPERLRAADLVIKRAAAHAVHCPDPGAHALAAVLASAQPGCRGEGGCDDQTSGRRDGRGTGGPRRGTRGDGGRPGASRRRRWRRNRGGGDARPGGRARLVTGGGSGG